MKNNKVLVYGIFILIIFIFNFSTPILNSMTTSDDISKTADGFTIEEYNVVLNVSKDNKVDVTENITVNWYDEFHHGILKFTPEWLEYTGKDNKTIKRKSVLTNYRAEGDEYTIDKVKRKPRIKIGSPEEFVPLGDKTYVIKYTYDMGSDPFQGFDEFIFNAYGDYWGTDIKNASITITMPDRIDDYKINFFTDRYRKNNINNIIDYNIEGNILYAKFNPDKNEGIELDKSLVVDIELPENYFTGGSFNYGWISLTLIIIALLITLYIIYMWTKFGKDYPKRAQTVEFYPPDNLSSAEIGYIYNNNTNKKLTISLIVELASKGYIKIDEVGKEKRIQITNLVSNKSNTTTDNNRIIDVTKLKESDNNISEDAKSMMMYMFSESSNKSLNTNIDKFLKVRDELIKGGYIKVTKDTSNNETIEKNNNNLPELTELEKIVYDKLFISNNVVNLDTHLTFYEVFDEVANILSTKLKDLINDKKATSKMYKSIFLIFVIAVLYYISYMTEDLMPSLIILYKAPIIFIIISILFTMIMRRKTQYGEDIIARTLGFKNFLEKAEKENLESLVEKDPKYFYNILPYTYVLGISKKWIKKFENIPMPEVDMGNFDYEDERSYNSIYDDMYRPEPTTSSSGSGCSSCGGGCSSCGGGCSSCGGGGSW